jgi:hypothetical protein
MSVQLVSTGITFPDATTQTTAAVGAASGVTNTTSAVSITLTSSSNKTQNVNMTAADKAVILPAATTITKLGSDLFTINNTGAYHFYIQLSAGGYINQVAPGSSVTLSLSDNTTSDGKWVQSDLGYTAYKMYDYSAFSIPSAVVLASTDANVPVNFHSITPLSATTYFIVYGQYSTRVTYGVVATLSGTSISYGTPVSLGTSDNSYGILKYSATTGIAILWTSASAGTLVFVPFSISGSTITVGTSASTNTVAAAVIPPEGQTLSSTLAAVIYQMNTGASCINTVRAVQYNGASAPTLGTPTTIYSPLTATNYGAAIGIVSATTALIIYQGSTASPYPTNTRVVTFSGTTAPTLGTAISLGTDVQGMFNSGSSSAAIRYVSGSEYSITAGGGYLWQKTVTVSGTTVSSPTAAVSVPQPMNSASDLATPSWTSATTGLVGTVGYYSTATYSAKITEAKYISGYGWLGGLTMPIHKAFYTPTGLNQPSGLSGYATLGSTAKWTALDSSTMVVTRAGSTTPGNQNYSVISWIIKPTT